MRGESRGYPAGVAQVETIDCKVPLQSGQCDCKLQTTRPLLSHLLAEAARERS